MHDDPFPSDDVEFPRDLQRALANLRTPDVVAALQVCALLSPIFRSPDNAAGTDTLGGAARFFFSVEFDNRSRRYLAGLAGISEDSIDVPSHLLPNDDAVAAAVRMWARHLLRRFADAQLLLEKLVDGSSGGAPRG